VYTVNAIKFMLAVWDHTKSLIMIPSRSVSYWGQNG